MTISHSPKEMDMNTGTGTGNESETTRKAEARTTLLIALIFGGLIIALIVGMAAFDLYAEKLQGASHRAPVDAADR